MARLAALQSISTKQKGIKTESEEGYEKLTESEVCDLVALIISYVLSDLGELKGN